MSSSYYQENKDTWKTVYYPRRKQILADPVERQKKNTSNRQFMRSRAGERKQRYLANRMFALRQLGGKCESCGFTDERALQFDHVANKKANLPTYFGMKSVTKLLDELHWCRLLCANCHAIETKMRGQLSVGRPKLAGSKRG